MTITDKELHNLNINKEEWNKISKMIELLQVNIIHIIYFFKKFLIINFNN
jgi:hypothetical protein